MQSQAATNDDGRDIVIPQIRFQKNTDGSKKIGVGCFILLGILFFGGGGAFVISQVASGRESVSFNGLPLGVVGGVIFCLGLLGYLLYNFIPAIGTLMGSPQIEAAKPTNCIISMKGVILHDKDGNKYILKWKGIQSLAILKDVKGEMYAAFYLSDRRYVDACKNTNSFVSTKYSHQFELILPESSLRTSAKDFIKLLAQRAQSQGATLNTQEMSETLTVYAEQASNSELDHLYEAGGKYMLPLLGFLPFLLFSILIMVFIPAIPTFLLSLLFYIIVYLFIKRKKVR